MSSSKKTAVSIFARAAATYNAVGPRHFTYFARHLVEYVDVRPGERVLDVATGTGEALLAAAERSGDRGSVVGIDLTVEMLERATAAIRDCHLDNAELRQMDAEQLKLPAESFDAALSAFALSSFPNRNRALKECRRVLCPGGRLGLVDAFDWYFQQDSRWQWQEEVLRSFGALDEVKQADSKPIDLSTTLSSVGFTAVQSIEDAVDLVFHDEEEWWRWSWSHGTRGLFERVPVRRRDEFKSRLLPGLQNCRESDGMIHATMCATLVRARKPERW